MVFFREMCTRVLSCFLSLLELTRDPLRAEGQAPLHVALKRNFLANLPAPVNMASVASHREQVRSQLGQRARSTRSPNEAVKPVAKAILHLARFRTREPIVLEKCRVDQRQHAEIGRASCRERV